MELLVVITVISILTTLVFGGVGRAKEHVARTQEVSAARLLINAFHSANSDLGRVFSAEMTESALGTIGNAPNVRYGTHLMPYIGEMEWDKSLYIHDSQRKEMNKHRNGGVVGLGYIRVLYPALGMNSPNVGGIYEDGTPRPVKGYVFATDLASVHHPEKLVVFVSAGTGVQTRFTNLVRGYFRVLPPFDQKFPEDGNMWGSTDDRYPSNTGNVHFRWDDTAVTAFFDGSIRMCSAADLSDPLNWENREQ